VNGHRRNGDVPVVGHPPPGFTRSQICRVTDVTATEALQLAEDRPFWRGGSQQREVSAERFASRWWLNV